MANDGDSRVDTSTWIPLFAVVVIAALLRIYGLGALPSGIYCDEAANGCDAYSILTTGRSLCGTPFPLFFDHHNLDYVEPLYTYLTAIPVALLGLSIFSTRLVAALAGSAAILTTFLLARELFDRRVGLVAAMLLAVSPWHLPFSRIAFRGILLPLFVTASVYLFLRMTRNVRYALPCALLWGASLYTYAVAKAFVPLFLASLVLVYRKQLWRRLRPTGERLHLVGAAVLFVALALPVYHFFFFGPGGKRFEAMSVLNAPAPLLAFFENLAQHVTPAFLFFSGDRNLRHSIPGFGELLVVLMPFLVLGLVAGLARRKIAYLVPVLGFIAGIVPPALTHEGVPHALRGLGAVPFLEILAALGIVECCRAALRWKRAAGVGLCAVTALAVAGNAGYFLYSYFGDYRFVSQHHFQYGLTTAMRSAVEEAEAYDAVVMSPALTQPQAFVIFFARPDLTDYQRDRKLGKYVVHTSGRAWEPLPPGRNLIVMPAAERFPAGVLRRVVPAADGTPLIKMVDYTVAEPAPG